MDLPLKEIHLPESVAQSFIPLGYMLLFLLLSILLVSAYFFWKFYQRPTLKKEVLLKLSQIETLFQETNDPVLPLRELSSLLRCLVLTENQENELGGLTGQSWLAYLDRYFQTDQFTKGVGQILLLGPYQKHVNPKEFQNLLIFVFKIMRDR